MFGLMKPSLPRFLAPDATSFNHLDTLARSLREAVDTLGQMFGATAETGGDILAQLETIDAQAGATHMALLTSLRSTYLLPLPREDLFTVSDRLNTAVQNTCTVGFVIHTARQYRLPNRALDVLEILSRQAELVAQAMRHLDDFDRLEEVWIQLERTGQRARRALISWQIQDASELLARHYYRQKEVARALEETFDALAKLAVNIGYILVRES